MIKIGKYQKSYFKLEDDFVYYKGYHIPKIEKEYANPYFTKEVADAIARNMDRYYEELVYHKENDIYVYREFQDGGINKFKKFIKDTIDGKKELYAIGTRSWMWKSYTLDEIKKENPKATIYKSDKANIKDTVDEIEMDY